MIVASSQGGVDIESVAAENPDAIIKHPIDINKGLSDEDALKLSKQMGFSEKSTGAVPNFLTQKAVDAMKKLYTLFIERDATQVEINPIAESASHDVYCMDAKLSFDDNADFRQSEIFSLRDTTQEDPRELKAAEAKLNYIGLDGNIGCLGILYF